MKPNNLKDWAKMMCGAINDWQSNMTSKFNSSKVFVISISDEIPYEVIARRSRNIFNSYLKNCDSNISYVSTKNNMNCSDSQLTTCLLQTANSFITRQSKTLNQIILVQDIKSVIVVVSDTTIKAEDIYNGEDNLFNDDMFTYHGDTSSLKDSFNEWMNDYDSSPFKNSTRF